MGKTVIVEEDAKTPAELEPEKTIEDEQLEAAIKAADEEAGTAETVKEVPGAVAPATTEPETVGAVETEKGPKMVPVGVVTALRKHNSELKHENANLAGQVQGMQAQGRPVQDEDPKPAVRSYEDQLKDIDDSLLDVSRLLDDGDITNEAAEKKRIELRKQERSITSEMNRAPEPVPVVTAEPMHDLALEEHMAQLVKDHPVLTELNQQQMEPLQALAYEQAERDGDPINAGALGTKNLRERMAKFATQIYGHKDPASTDEVPAPATTGLTETEIAKRDAKLKIAQNHPADVSQLGSATGTQAVSDEEALTRMENMSVDEQISYLEANPALAERLEGSA